MTMFNKINKYKFWISGGVICILGMWYLASMLRFSGVADVEKNDNSLISQAKQCYLNGAYKNAVSLYEKLLILEPVNTAAILDLAIIYDDYLDMDERAIELYRKYLNLEPKAEKKALIEDWIKNAAHESLGLKNTINNPELESLKKENQNLKEEVQTLSGKLYTIQSDFEKEIKKLQEERERIAGELMSSRVRIGKLNVALSRSENSKKELLEKLEEAIRKEKAAKVKIDYTKQSK